MFMNKTMDKYIIYKTQSWRFSIKNETKSEVVSQNLVLSWFNQNEWDAIRMFEYSLQNLAKENKEVNDRNVLTQFFKDYESVYWPADEYFSNDLMDLSEDLWDLEDDDFLDESIHNIDFDSVYSFLQDLEDNPDYVKDYLNEEIFYKQWSYWYWLNVKLHNRKNLSTYKIEELIWFNVLSNESVEKLNKIASLKWKKNPNDLDDILNLIENDSFLERLDNYYFMRVEEYAWMFTKYDDEIKWKIDSLELVEFDYHFDWSNWWYLIVDLSINNEDVLNDYEELLYDFNNADFDDENERFECIEKVYSSENREVYEKQSLLKNEKLLKDFNNLVALRELIENRKSKYLEKDMCDEAVSEFFDWDNEDLDKEINDYLNSLNSEFSSNWLDNEKVEVLSNFIKWLDFKFIKSSQYSYELKRLISDKKLNLYKRFEPFRYPYFWTWHKEIISYLYKEKFWNQSSNYDKMIKDLIWWQEALDSILWKIQKELLDWWVEQIKNDNQFVYSTVADHNYETWEVLFWLAYKDGNSLIKKYPKLTDFLLNSLNNWDNTDFINWDFISIINEELWSSIENLDSSNFKWIVEWITNELQTISKEIKRYNAITENYYLSLDRWSLLGFIFNSIWLLDIERYKTIKWELEKENSILNQIQVYRQVVESKNIFKDLFQWYLKY